MTAIENTYSLLRELEAEQARIANGGTDPVKEQWIPVQRVKMSDAEVDALVEGAEVELVVIAAEPKTKVVKKAPKKTTKAKKAPKKVAAKKVKKIDIARDLFKANKKAERKDVLKMFIKKLKMSAAAASTYYQICKHG